MGRRSAYAGLLVVCTTLGACQAASSTDAGVNGAPDADASGCSLHDGEYEFTYQRRAGDCDDYEDALQVIEQQIQFMGEFVRIRNGRVVPKDVCFSESTKLNATCALDVRRTCALKAPLSGSYTVTGELTIDEDTLEGSLTFSVTATGLNCSDKYDAKGQRTD